MNSPACQFSTASPVSPSASMAGPVPVVAGAGDASLFAVAQADLAHARGDMVSELFWLNLALDALEAGE